MYGKDYIHLTKLHLSYKKWLNLLDIITSPQAKNKGDMWEKSIRKKNIGDEYRNSNKR